MQEEPSWSWSYGSWIYNYLCNQCLSLLMLWVRTPLKRGVLDTTLLVAGQWFTPVSSTNNTDCLDITEILLKMALNTLTLTPINARQNKLWRVYIILRLVRLYFWKKNIFIDALCTLYYCTNYRTVILFWVFL